MVRLSDLYAPEWTLPVGEEVWTLKPLSLKTLAEAEGQRIFLEELQAGQEAAWGRFLAFLSGRSVQEVQEALVKYPLALETFQRQVLWSFGATDDQEPVRRRTVKNPLKDNEKKEVRPEPVDFGFLLTLSRFSGIALSDLFRMSLRGLAALQKDLEKNPPVPKLI